MRRRRLRCWRSGVPSTTRSLGAPYEKVHSEGNNLVKRVDRLALPGLSGGRVKRAPSSGPGSPGRTESDGIRALLAADYSLQAHPGAASQAALAREARRPGPHARGGAGPLRGSHLTRLPPPRNPPRRLPGFLALRKALSPLGECFGPCPRCAGTCSTYCYVAAAIALSAFAPSASLLPLWPTAYLTR